MNASGCFFDFRRAFWTGRSRWAPCRTVPALIAVALAWSWLLASRAAVAGTLYISSSRGSDCIGDGTPSRPFRTPTAAQAVASPGWTFELEPGDYPGPALFARPGHLVVFPAGTAVIGGTNPPPPLSLLVEVGPEGYLEWPSEAALPASMTFHASARRCGSPVPASFSWSFVSGPSQPDFVEPTGSSTTVRFWKFGENYWLKVTATAGTETAIRTFRVKVVLPGNSAPTISMAPNLTIYPNAYPVWTNVIASITDDGRPADPGEVRTTWSPNVLPGGVSIVNRMATNRSPFVLTTRLGFTGSGTWVLPLVATDGDPGAGKPGLTSTSNLTVKVDRLPASYLTDVVTSSPCLLGGFQRAVRNSHPSQRIWFKARIWQSGGQVPGTIYSTNTATLSAGASFLLPCGGTTEILEAAYVSGLAALAGRDQAGSQGELGRPHLGIARWAGRPEDHPSSGALELTLSGVGRGRYRVEVSGDLREWTKLADVATDGSPVEIHDDPVGNAVARFYRAYEIPSASGE